MTTNVPETHAIPTLSALTQSGHTVVLARLALWAMEKHVQVNVLNTGNLFKDYALPLTLLFKSKNPSESQLSGRSTHPSVRLLTKQQLLLLFSRIPFTITSDFEIF